MNLNRVYKLLKLGIKIDRIYAEVFDCFDSKLTNLVLFEMEQYPGYVMLMNKERESNIFIFDKKEETLYVNHKCFLILEEKYKLNTLEIHQFIHEKVFEYYGFDSKQSTFLTAAWRVHVEKTYSEISIH